jgi:hypothetical protein
MSAQMKYCQNILFAATIYLRNTNDILMNIKISDPQLNSESFKMNSSDNTAQQSRLFQWGKKCNKEMNAFEKNNTEYRLPIHDSFSSGFCYLC